MDEFKQSGNTVYSEQTIAKTRSRNCKEGFDLHVYPVTWPTVNINGKWDCGIYSANMAPISRGHLALNSANPLGQPIIDQGYLNDPGDKDITVLMEGLELIREISHQKDLSALIGDELLETSKITSLDDIRNSALHYYHPVGTCKMGPDSDSKAVVNTVGKVHGMDNLYVVDASIMPNVPRGNTNIPVAMVAERIVSTLI